MASREAAVWEDVTASTTWGLNPAEAPSVLHLLIPERNKSSMSKLIERSGRNHSTGMSCWRSSGLWGSQLWMPSECSGWEPGSFGEPRLWTDQRAPAASAQPSTDRAAEAEMQGISQKHRVSYPRYNIDKKSCFTRSELQYSQTLQALHLFDCTVSDHKKYLDPLGGAKGNNLG